MSIVVTRTIADGTKIALDNTIFSPAQWVCKLMRDQFRQWLVVEWELVDGCIVLLFNQDNNNRNVETFYSDEWYNVITPNWWSFSDFYVPANKYAYWIIKFVETEEHTLPPNVYKEIMLFQIFWFSYRSVWLYPAARSFAPHRNILLHLSSALLRRWRI